jgi:hypothetical protein
MQPFIVGYSKNHWVVNYTHLVSKEDDVGLSQLMMYILFVSSNIGAGPVGVRRETTAPSAKNVPVVIPFEDRSNLSVDRETL